MKLLLWIAFLFGITKSIAQNRKEFFDYKWDLTVEENASYYSLVTKTDSGWQRQDFFVANNQLQMIGNYEDDSCKIKNGNFIYYYYNGKKSVEEKYAHNERDGLYLSYHSNEKLADSTFYTNGKQVGIAKSYFNDGTLKDSSFFSREGNGISMSWFQNKNLNCIMKYQHWDTLSGVSKFFHLNGQLASIEEYKNGALINKKYYNEKGSSMDTLDHDKLGFPLKGIKHWRKYLDKSIAIYTKERNNYPIPVIVMFQVNVDGSISNVSVKLPLRQSLDQAAKNVVQNYPELWTPTISHNRKIPDYFQQAIFFHQ